MSKTILITGTSSGYGKATALHFLSRGWNVIATMRRPDPALFGQHAERLRPLPLDVTSEDSIAALVEAAGHVDIVEIGRASVREREWEYVKIMGGAVYLKKKH